ncbi:MAG: hypothetical protein OXE52_05510, partial [Chloroflexi bacterium]|nr:hypothetical protein [Chloroflexota bacterium]
GRYERLGSTKPLCSLAFGDFGFSMKQVFPVNIFSLPAGLFRDAASGTSIAERAKQRATI